MTRFLLAALLHTLALAAQAQSLTEPPKEAPSDKTLAPFNSPTLPSGGSSTAADQAITATEQPALKTSLASTDLWDRIRRGFAMPDLQSNIVQNREQWYSSRPDYIARMTERSSKYLFHIVEELEARKMPMELALLPFIESAFNPQAVSSAKAAGMWQFIPSTGKHFDLKQNAFRDDRRDVLASTRAALDYLQKLHGMFGDWHLALAAYNWGEGSVGRAMAKNQRLGKSTGYEDLAMPNETRYYVPKLQAVKNIIANPSAFSASLPQIPDHPYFQTVEIRKDIDTALAAKLADVPLEDFKALNPSLNRPVILAAGTPKILLPWDQAAVFERNIDAHKGQLASWTAWVAPANLKPSEAAKRTGMSEQLLRQVNLIPIKASLIKAGSSLLVPRSAQKQEDVSAHVADHGQVNVNTPKVRAARSAASSKAKHAGKSKHKSAAKNSAAPKNAPSRSNGKRR